MREQTRRRVLYGATITAWGAATLLAVHAGVTESIATRIAMTLCIGIAMCTTTASLMAVFVMPLDAVYKHGFEAGRATAPGQPVRGLSSNDTDGDVVEFRRRRQG